MIVLRLYYTCFTGNCLLRGVSRNLHYLSGGVELFPEGCFRELALSFWESGTLL
jgi:hypothetical protein